MNLKVVKDYLLKELFRKLSNYQRNGWAARYLKQWFWWATHSRMKPLRDFAWMLRNHEEGILPISISELTSASLKQSTIMLKLSAIGHVGIALRKPFH